MTVKKTISSAEQDQTAESSRRQFFKKAGVGAAMITTVASRPVWAGQCSMSGLLSGDLSNHGHVADCTANGISPGGYTTGISTGPGDNVDLWNEGWLSPYSKQSTAASILDDNSLTYTPNSGGAPLFYTIEEALLGKLRDGGKVDKLIKGRLKQAVCAALNAVLWSQMYSAAQLGQPYPAGLFDDKDFYINFTLADIQALWARGVEFVSIGDVIYTDGHMLLYVQEID